MGDEPGIGSRPTGSERCPLRGIEVAKNEFKLINGRCYENDTFADRSLFQIENGLHSVPVAGICAQSPHTFCGVGQNTARRYVARRMADQRVKSIVQGGLGTIVMQPRRLRKRLKSTSVDLEGQVHTSGGGQRARIAAAHIANQATQLHRQQCRHQLPRTQAGALHQGIEGNRVVA